MMLGASAVARLPLGSIGSRRFSHGDVVTRSRTNVAATAIVLQRPPDMASLIYLYSTLTLGSTHPGITTATLNPGNWTDVKGVRPGFRITAPSETGLGDTVAVVLEEPQYLSQTVQVRIISEFAEISMPPNGWLLLVPEGTNFNDEIYTPGYFRSSNLLSAYMEDFKKLVVQDSQYITERASDFRKWDKIDREFLNPLALTMGLDIDIDRYDVETKRRAIHEWIPFCQYAETEHFVQFLGYTLNITLDIDHLWTNDYKSFVKRTPNITYPAYYPTNHVALSFDLLQFDIENQATITYIYKLFYYLASVPLVLEYLDGHVTDSGTLWIAGADYARGMRYDYTTVPPNFWIAGADYSYGILFSTNSYTWLIPTDAYNQTLRTTRSSSTSSISVIAL
jgi:hypothetical protein